MIQIQRLNKYSVQANPKKKIDKLEKKKFY